jgi:hypothetical protein
LFSTTKGWVPWPVGRAGRSTRVTPPWAAVPVVPPELDDADEDIDSDEPEDDSEGDADDDASVVGAAEDELDGALLGLDVLELALLLELLHAVVTRAMRPTAATATVVLRRMETFPEGDRPCSDRADGGGGAGAAGPRMSR